MSYTGGLGGSGGSIMDMMRGWLTGGTQAGTVVGQEQPEWDFPYGQDRLPDDVIGAYFRGDAGPTGLNEYLMKMKESDPGIIDRFRSYVNMGLIKPKNQAAQQIVLGNGGFQAGDMTPLGPMINGSPWGLNPSQLNTLANVLQSGVQYNLGIIEASGYLNNVPTLERDRIMGELAQGWMTQAINQFNASETQRHNMAGEDIDQQKVINDNIQNMAKIFGGQMETDPATGQSTFKPTEEARQFNTEQSGYLDGQATLTREQQAFNQAKDVANLMSNPRNYIEAQMLANSRGGLNGMAPTNSLQQTTFGPATTAGAGGIPQSPQFNTPGGANQQMPTLGTMQGLPNGVSSPAGQDGQAGIEPWMMGGQAAEYKRQQAAMLAGMTQEQRDAYFQQQAGGPQAMGFTAPGGQAGGQANTPTPQAQAAQQNGGWGNLTDPANWSSMGGQAGGMYTGTALPGLDAIRNSQGFQSMMPASNTPTQTRPNYPSFGAPGAATQHLGASNGQNVAAANQGQKFATSNFTQSLLQNRVVPKSGGLATPGQYMTQAQMGMMNPNKIRTQDYLRGTPSQQQGFGAVGSMAGYSDDDLQGIMKQNLPTFKAPGAGRMV